MVTNWYTKEDWTPRQNMHVFKDSELHMHVWRMCQSIRHALEECESQNEILVSRYYKLSPNLVNDLSQNLANLMIVYLLERKIKNNTTMIWEFQSPKNSWQLLANWYNKEDWAPRQNMHVFEDFELHMHVWRMWQSIRHVLEEWESQNEILVSRYYKFHKRHL